MKKASLLILAGVALMACTPADKPTETASTAPATTEPATPPPEATPAPPVTPADPTADTCNMAQYASLVGKPSTDAAVPPASATVRIIKPGDQVTMDFSATRLNIEVGADGMVTAVRCG
ncbi:MAG TPA: I78 family peptidase inhibitor [Hyphomonadaceae bacterium]|nr:I78 family peptidase inhibitor [Hyphomonadaceae bacterium]